MPAQCQHYVCSYSPHDRGTLPAIRDATSPFRQFGDARCQPHTANLIHRTISAARDDDIKRVCPFFCKTLLTPAISVSFNQSQPIHKVTSEHGPN